jgi:branched-chain amino acid transport system ATP-binding protein
MKIPGRRPVRGVSSDTANALEVRDLSTGYGDIKVVSGVSFEIPRASVTALFGRNGAGKTTTLRAIAGLNEIQSGFVLIGGTDVSSVPSYARAGYGLAYVQEGKRVFKARTVEENIYLGAFSVRLPRRKMRSVVNDAFDRFPALAARRRHEAGVLSGGQQQMLAIAQALASGPELLLLDEPSAGLSPVLVQDVADIVRGLKEDGLSILFAEQSVDIALEIADNVVIMDLGKVVYNGSARVASIGSIIEDAYFTKGSARDIGVHDS